MYLINMVDCAARVRKRGTKNDLYIESMRFDKSSKCKLQDILKTRSPNSDNMVMRVSCLFIDHDNFKNIKPGDRYSGAFFPDEDDLYPFEIRDFDMFYNSNKVVEYDDYVEISDVSMIIYSV